MIEERSRKYHGSAMIWVDDRIFCPFRRHFISNERHADTDFDRATLALFVSSSPKRAAWSLKIFALRLVGAFSVY